MRSSSELFEEDSLKTLEGKLGFHKNKAKTVDLIIRKYSTGRDINSFQLVEIKKLLLPELSYTAWPELLEFFDKFMTSGSCYDRDMLLLLGILLGSAPAMKKADLLFEVFDESQTQSISKARLYDMIDCMLKIAIDCVPLLASPKFSLPASLRDIAAYVANLRQRKNQAKLELGKLIFKYDVVYAEELSKGQFIRAFTFDPAMERLLTFSGIRKFISEKIVYPDSFSNTAGLLFEDVIP